MMMRILGIDLGTNGSAAAVLIDGKVQLVASPDMYKSAKPFPSVVSFFEDGGCLIGTHALEQAAYNPHGTVSNIKREILDYKRRGLQPSSGYLIDSGELEDDELHQDAADVKYAIIIIIIIIIPRFLSCHICSHTHSFCILDSQELHQTLHQG